MIPIFDLDDTLYPERTYVESGFKSVSAMLYDEYSWDQRQSMRHMLDTLQQKGRGAVFNDLLHSHGVFSARLVQLCVQTYRQHLPEIAR